MQPPALSVAVLHFGHGFVVTCMAIFDASSHRALAMQFG